MKTQIEGRTCTKCSEWKSADCFRKDPRYKGGLFSWCKDCNRKYMRERRKKDYTRIRKVEKRRHLRLRREVLEAYSDGVVCCACCGEDTYQFMSLDHIDGGGNEHRRLTGAGSTGVFYELKREGFPPGYQVLCHNCNLAKGFHGKCPHQDQ